MKNLYWIIKISAWTFFCRMHCMHVRRKGVRCRFQLDQGLHRLQLLRNWDKRRKGLLRGKGRRRALQRPPAWVSWLLRVSLQQQKNVTFNRHKTLRPLLMWGSDWPRKCKVCWSFSSSDAELYRSTRPTVHSCGRTRTGLSEKDSREGSAR